MKAYRKGKLTVVVILSMMVFFWQSAQAGTILLSGSFNAAEAEYYLGSFTFQAPIDGQLLINMDNPDGSADGEIVFTNITTGLRYNDGLFYGTTDVPLFNPHISSRVRITQGRVHSLYVLPVRAGWGLCDYDVSYVSWRGTQNSGTNSITITYVRRPLTQVGAELLVSLTSDRFESNSESATFDAGNGGWLLLDLVQSGTGGGYHSVYLNGRGIEYNQVGDPHRVMGVHTAVEIGAGTNDLMIRHEDNAWFDNSGVRRTDVYFIPYPFKTYYVDADAGGSNDGSRWEDAYNHLQNALTAALYGDEIRVAQGIYKPTGYVPPPPPPPPPPPMADSNEQEDVEMTGIREVTFQLINGVVIKGGYAGFGEPEPNARDISAYETVLSGDIGIPGNSLDNSFHVVTGSDCDSTAVLDGFTITCGNANGVVGDYDNRCGAGMFNASGSPTVINCTFSRNSAAQDGGGLYNRQNSSPTVTNCKFIANSAKYGGGMYHRWDSNSTVTNCIFSRNFAEMYGGGIFNWCVSSPTLRNCTFSGNTAPAGNALSCNSNKQQYPSNVRIVNCILWDGGNEIVNVDNSVILVTYSDVQDGYYGTGNIIADPCFVDGGYWDANGVWIDGDYHLLQTSACINAADNNSLPADTQDLDSDGNTIETIPFDIEGNPRIIGGRVDMGAYEFNHIPVADAGNDQTVEAQAPWGATITLDGSGSSDADSTPGTSDDITDFNWYLLDPCDPNADVFLGSGQIVDCNLPIGEHIILLEVIDKAGAYDTNEVIIIVQDTTPPDINCPPDVILECPADTTTSQTGKATATDTCGDVTISFRDRIFPKCGNTKTIKRTWIATDEYGNSSSCVQIITVVDTKPPAITCPADVTLECPADTSVEANGSATADDTCGSVAIAHSDLWQPGCGNTGTLTRTWTATDECGNSSSCMQAITVVDTTPPEFNLSVAPTMLWPPNHKMYEITLSWTVSDECGTSPDVSLVGIVANEGDNTIGDGHTTNDIQINEDGSIYLRSERSGTGNDRVYTITYQAVDDCGNTTIRSATVSIPHDFKVLARIASRWLWSGPAGRIPEDLNGDGVVNLADVARFAGNWTK